MTTLACAKGKNSKLPRAADDLYASKCEDLKVRKGGVCSTPMTSPFLAGAKNFADGPRAAICSATQLHRARFLSLRCGDLDRVAAPRAVAAIDADRHRPLNGHAAHDAPLIAVIIDRLVLRRAIIPDHHVARRPAPPHGVLQPRHVILQHGKQLV